MRDDNSRYGTKELAEGSGRPAGNFREGMTSERSHYKEPEAERGGPHL